MTDFLQRLKTHELVQWAIAYVAFAFALIQVLDVMSGSYGCHGPAPDRNAGVMSSSCHASGFGCVTLIPCCEYRGVPWPT